MKPIGPDLAVRVVQGNHNGVVVREGDFSIDCDFVLEEPVAN